MKNKKIINFPVLVIAISSVIIIYLYTMNALELAWFLTLKEAGIKVTQEFIDGSRQSAYLRILYMLIAALPAFLLFIKLSRDLESFTETMNKEIEERRCGAILLDG